MELFQKHDIAVTDVSGLYTQTSGNGLINVVEAFKEIAVQTAVIEDFVIVGGGEPIQSGAKVTISGKYIPGPDATVFLGDEELEIDGEPTDTEITAISVVPFVGNPELTVFTNSGDLPGGGESNGLTFCAMARSN